MNLVDAFRKCANIVTLFRRSCGFTMEMGQNRAEETIDFLRTGTEETEIVQLSSRRTKYLTTW